MDNIINWQYKELFPSNTERLIQFLISELIFLDKSIKLIQNEKDKKLISDSYEKIENLLDTQQKNINKVLSKREYEKKITLVYKILKKISNNIEYFY